VIQHVGKMGGSQIICLLGFPNIGDILSPILGADIVSLVLETHVTNQRMISRIKNMNKKINHAVLKQWVLAAAIAVVLTACGGGGGVVQPEPTIPLPITGVPVTEKFSAGAGHSCAVLSGGKEVKCWGGNNHGQLGDGATPESSFTPALVSGLSLDASARVIGVSADSNHTCALLEEGQVRCWGSNSDGQLGDGATIDVNTGGGSSVVGLNDAKAIAVGPKHSCAIQVGGSVVCWGSNNQGQLGNGTTTASLTPVQVTGLTDAVALSLNGFGVFSSSCALRAVGKVVCWGNQFDNQIEVTNGGLSAIGNGSSALTPVEIAGLTDARAIATGQLHACALVGVGEVKCWGLNGFGEIGNGSGSLLTKVATPVSVTGLSNAVALSAGSFMTCAVLTDATVKCWGLNAQGQMGNGSLIDQPTPAAVSGLADAVSVSSKGQHVCTMRTNNLLSCWGGNSNGKLGDGTTVNRSVPTDVLGGNIFLQR
jgi:alpha-tubulin suppressor-like RCC1 family protein